MASLHEYQERKTLEAEQGISAPFALGKIGQALELPENEWTEKEILEQTKRLVARYKEICGGLRSVVEQYKLGLGGEPIDRLVIEEIHRLRGGKA